MEQRQNLGQGFAEVVDRESGYVNCHVLPDVFLGSFVFFGLCSACRLYTLNRPGCTETSMFAKRRSS
jgi:hypothetical protein